MAATIKSELDGIKERVMSLSMEGKYGQAVQLLKKTIESNAMLMSSDDDNYWSNFWKGFFCTDACINCGESSGGGCCGSYCVGLMVCFFCCGEDVASACCCDWISDGCT